MRTRRIRIKFSAFFIFMSLIDISPRFVLLLFIFVLYCRRLERFFNFSSSSPIRARCSPSNESGKTTLPRRKFECVAKGQWIEWAGIRKCIKLERPISLYTSMYKELAFLLLIPNSFQFSLDSSPSLSSSWLVSFYIMNVNLRRFCSSLLLPRHRER